MLAVLLSLLTAYHLLPHGVLAQDFQLNLVSDAKVDQYPQASISLDGILWKSPYLSALK